MRGRRGVGSGVVVGVDSISRAGDGGGGGGFRAQGRVRTIGGGDGSSIETVETVETALRRLFGNVEQLVGKKSFANNKRDETHPGVQEKAREPSHVPRRDARPEHGAVMVEPFHAVPAETTVRGSRRPPHVARDAVLYVARDETQAMLIISKHANVNRKQTRG